MPACPRLVDPAAGRVRRPWRPSAASGCSTTHHPGARSSSLHWVDEKGNESGKPIDVYVPPGESRVVHVPRAGDSGPSIVSGSRETLTASTTRSISWMNGARSRRSPISAPIAPTITTGLLYYLDRVFVDTMSRRTCASLPSSPAGPGTRSSTHPLRSGRGDGARPIAANVPRLEQYVQCRRHCALRGRRAGAAGDAGRDRGCRCLGYR